MKPKLLPLDTFLPFFCNGKEIGMFKKASVFVFTADFKSSTIEPSKFYQAMLSSLGINIQDLSLDKNRFSLNNSLQKCIFAIIILCTLAKPSKYQKVVFGLNDVSGILAKIIRFCLKINGILNCTFILAPTTQSLFERTTKSNGARNNSIAVNADLILSSYSLDGKIPKNMLDKVRYVGYGRAYTPWWDAVGKISKTKSFKDLPLKQFIYWPLNTLYRNNNGLELHIGDGDRDLLSGLAKLDHQPLIIFKYHPTTNKNQFASILKSSGYKNYRISNEHSNVLIERCKMLISTMGTTVFVDANYRKKPCMLFISPETLKGESDGIFDELVYEDFSQFIVVNDLDKARDLVQKKFDDLIELCDGKFFDFKDDIATDEKFAGIFDMKVQ